jgi:2-keto-4-pentenoate hydratase
MTTAMDRDAIDRAAKLLDKARRTGNRLDRLPETSRPRSAVEAYAIQLATVAEMGGSIAGWKVAVSAEYGLLIGILVRSRVFQHGTAISSTRLSMRGVEAEIAFRFDQTLPPRELTYERADVEAAVTAFPAIEIVDSRFRDYHGTLVIDRAADFMSNGGFVVGSARDDWRSFDLAKLEARLTIDGVEIVRRVGGHSAGDPLIPAIALANYLRTSTGAPAGMVTTTGTFTGLEFAKVNSVVQATFEGFGSVTCQFEV